MPRLARLDAPGVLHHIIIRGSDGIQSFRELIFDRTFGRQRLYDDTRKNH